MFSKLIDKYEQTIDGKEYVVEYWSATPFNPCYLTYHTSVHEIENGRKKLVLKSASNDHTMKPDCWMNKVKEEKERLLRINQKLT